jgi:hypothetical protein
VRVGDDADRPSNCIDAYADATLADWLTRRHEPRVKLH